MAETSTFVKLDRSILKWSWYKDNNTKSLFIHLLLKANWEDNKFLNTPVNRGQIVVSTGHLAEELGLTINKVRTALRHLISTNEITSLNMHQYLIITIVNYDKYQGNHELGTNESRDGNDNIRNKEYKNNKNYYRDTKKSNKKSYEERKHEYEELAREYNN